MFLLEFLWQPHWGVGPQPATTRQRLCLTSNLRNSDSEVKNHQKNIQKPHTCLWNCLLEPCDVVAVTLINDNSDLPRSAKSKAKKWPPLAQRSRKSLAWKWGENDNAPGSCHGAATWPFNSQISWLRRLCERWQDLIIKWNLGTISRSFPQGNSPLNSTH